MFQRNFRKNCQRTLGSSRRKLGMETIKECVKDFKEFESLILKEYILGPEGESSRCY